MDSERKASEVVDALVTEFRDRCLWFLRPDYYSRSREGQLRVLDYIERYGDRDAYRKAAGVRQWLSRPSSVQSAVS